MTYSTSFDGADGTALSSLPSWASTAGYYNVLQLDGAGAVKHITYEADAQGAMNETGVKSHYVKAVVGAGFVGSGETIGINVCMADRGDSINLMHGATLVLKIDGAIYAEGLSGHVAAAGDELEMRWDAQTRWLTVKKNGATIYDADFSYHVGDADTGKQGTSTGIALSYAGRTATSDIFRSWESGGLSPADGTPPTLTGSITVGAKTSSTVDLSWPAGSDDTGIVAYDVRVNGGSWIDNGTGLSYTATGLAALTEYTFDVTARDAAGNRSTAISTTTSTYRAGALASTILLVTGPQDGNPAGFLYAFAGTVSAGDWLSYTIVSGPTPAGGSLDANAMGAFSYTGPAPATMVIQPEVNGANAPETITVTLYDNSVSLGAASMASTPTYGSGPVSQAAPVPLTGTAVAVASAYGSGQIAQGAPVVLAGAAFAVIPAMGNGAVSQGAPVALSGAALAVVPAMGAGGLMQGVPVALSATPFAVIPVFSAGALSQAAPVALMGAALSVSTAYGPGAISDAPTFTSMAPSPVCATYRRDSYPAHTFQKLAGETLDFDIDFRYELRSTQDAARIHDPVEIQAGQGVEVLGAYWVPGLRRVKMWIAGGEAQGKSDISIWLNTEAGRRLQVDVRVQIN